MKTVFRSPVALLVAVTLAIMLTTVALAIVVYSVVVPSQVTVVQAPTPTPTPTPTPAPDYTISVYSDAGGTILLTQVAWGWVYQGGVLSQNVWVRNLGDQPASVDVVMSPVAGLTLTVPQAPLALAIGALGQLTLNLSVDSATIPGVYAPDITFQNNS